MSKIVIEYDTTEPIESVIETLQRLATVRTMEQIKDSVRKEFAEEIAELKKQAEGLNKADEKKVKRWSRKFDACIKCHNGDSPHASKGVCARCYAREKKREEVKVPVAREIDSSHVDTRPSSQKT